MKTIVGLILFFFSVGCFAMPECTGSPKVIMEYSEVKSWSNCSGDVSFKVDVRYFSKFSKGERYVGGWKNGLFHGSGEYSWVSGDKYEGTFKDGLKSGKGVYTYPNGDKHFGFWKMNRKFGKGTHKAINGDIYEGNWKDGKLHGLGTFTFANGDKFYGDFTNAPGKNIRKWIRVNFLLINKNEALANLDKEFAQVEKSTLKLDIAISEVAKDGSVTLSINTNSETSSLKINGEEQGGDSIGKYEITRYAKAGMETSFIVVAVDSMGNIQSKTVSVTRSIDEPLKDNREFLSPHVLSKVESRDAVAIIIGIENYKNVPKASYANNDASSFYDYAVKVLGVPENKIKLLIDKNADVIDIERALKNWLPLNTDEGVSDIYFFYSGHGLPSNNGDNFYILPYDVEIDFLDRTAISQDSLIQDIKLANPKSAILFLDSCYSGSTRDGGTLMASARPLVITNQDKQYPSNFSVLSATVPNQISFSNPALKHGIFSFYLMKGLEGYADGDNDGKIIVSELDKYLRISVGNSALTMNKRQTPYVVGDFEKVIVER